MKFIHIALAATALVSAPAFASKEMAQKNACMACHAVDRKMVGPSFQDIAKKYQAACTPDFYLFDANGGLVYRGQFDDARPSLAVPVTGKDLRAAVDALLASKSPLVSQRASIGCNIKWKPGSAPDYFTGLTASE